MVWRGVAKRPGSRLILSPSPVHLCHLVTPSPCHRVIFFSFPRNYLHVRVSCNVMQRYATFPPLVCCYIAVLAGRSVVQEPLSLYKTLHFSMKV